MTEHLSYILQSLTWLKALSSPESQIPDPLTISGNRLLHFSVAGNARIPLSGQSGFSLIEILVAFSIAAAALVLLFTIQARATTAAILAGEYTGAVIIAESKLQAAGIRGVLDNSGYHGREGPYRWSVLEEEYPDTSVFESPIKLKKIVIKISWQNRGRARSISLQTLQPDFTP